MRIAIIDPALCKSKRCNQECVRFCPLNRSGTKTVWIDEDKNRAVIEENLCTGCGICVKKCPYKAIKIINLPEELEEDLVFRYGPNAFKLYRLPIPKQGLVVGIIGRNGVGKTTALRILAGEIMPNLGRYDRHFEWKDIIRYFRGSELQPYFEKLSSNKIKAVHKIQAIDKIPKYVKGVVGDILERIDEKNYLKKVKEVLNLDKIWDRRIEHLSGGELQKVAIAAMALREADIYLIDEPASYLDVKERLRVAKFIRSLASEDKYVIVVEHDLAVLDYTSDLIHIIYGDPGVYGIVSLPRGVRAGINTYLKGFLKEENIRIRNDPILFHLRPAPIEWRPETTLISWSKLVKELNGFRLEVKQGEVHMGEVVGILGPNGIGKTTFVKILAGILKPDEGYVAASKSITISYKPQFLSEIKYEGTLRSFFIEVTGKDPETPDLKTEIIKPLELEPLLDRSFNEMSGGELQRSLIAITMSKDADIYLLDEPMAYLDIEQRFTVAKIIKRLTEGRQVATFIVEHDIIAQDFLSMSVMVFSGIPGKKGQASAPQSLRKGMNLFLKEIGVTFRRDPDTKRPRINKEGSWLDRRQKEINEYYYVPTGEEELES